MLVLASLACVAVLTATLASGRKLIENGGLPGGTWLLAALVAVGGAGTIYLLYETITSMRRQASRAQDEARELRRQLAAAEALIKAEPQVLMHWEQGRGFSVVTNTLTGVPGLPGNAIELVRFNFWLDQKSIAALKSALDGLLSEGRAFNLILKTAAGGHIEADGRAAGARAVLRFKDVAGYKRDLSVILDQHMRLARDVRSSRALLSALPHPAWLSDASDRLTWVNSAYVKAVDAESEAEVIDGQISLLESRQRKAVSRVLKSGQTYNDRIPLVDRLGAQGARGHRTAARRRHGGCGDRRCRCRDREGRTGPSRSPPTTGRSIAWRRRLRSSTPSRSSPSSTPLTRSSGSSIRIGSPPRRAMARCWTDCANSGRLPEVVNYREWKERLLKGYTEESELEDWWHLPDGRVVHVMGAQRPDGGVTYLYKDETERLALESDYNALINVQRETLDSLNEGVAVFGTDGRLKLHNSSFAAIWKLSPKKLDDESPHIDEFIRITRALHGGENTWLEISSAVTAFEDREPLEGQMVRPDQSVIDYAVTPLPDGGTLLTFVDVTDSKRYERALIERNEALVTADKLKNQFISHISYELRTPLTNIIGFSELLANPIFGALTARQKEYLEDISFSSKTLLAIIDDILDLATIDAGGLELTLETVDVRAIIDQAIISVRERAAHARLTLDIAIADDATTFMADTQRVRQVLQNLLSNAVGFSKPEGVVHLSCWRENGEMVFMVEDEGVGIPKDQQERIFERFESRSQGSKHRGAGLGLSIVKSLVDLHGGDTVLDSEPGRGTKVTVRFPERGLEENVNVPTSTETDAARSGTGRVARH